MTTSQSSSHTTHPLLIVISGPSGVGKDAVLSRMRELNKPYHFPVTATTRPQRPAERDGVDYNFLSNKKFRQMIEREELLEWAEVYGNLYGVPKAQAVEALNKGCDVIVKVDIQGAATIKKLAPDAIYIFLAAADMEELKRRLMKRMTEPAEMLRLRLSTAKREMNEASKSDYVVVNHQDRLDEAVEEIERIVARERVRTPARRVIL